MLKSKSLQLVVGCLISFILIAWLAKTVKWTEVLLALESAHYIYFIPLTLIILVQFLIRAIRWKFLLPASYTTDCLLRYDSIMVGNFANFFLPFRAGEFLRPLYLSSRSELSFSISFVSIVLERFFDLSCVLLCFSILLLFAEGIPEWVFNGAYILSFLACGILLFIFVATKWPKRLETFIDWVLKPLDSVGFLRKLKQLLRSFLSELLEGAAVLKDTRSLIAVVVITALVWSTTIFQVYFSLFLFDGEYLIVHALAITVILALAVAAPSAPGFVGVYQVACLAAFALFNMSAEKATAFAIVTHLHQYLVFIVYIIVLSFRGGLKFSDLKLSRSSEVA